MNIKDIVSATPVMPVIVIEQIEHAVPLAKALVAGGIKVLEVTLRTPEALDAVKAMAEQVPEAIVGVGTLTQAEQFQQCLDAGAQFAVSPGLTQNIIDASLDSPLPLLPGVFTPSEAMRAADAGFEYLKLFPAQQAGGMGMLKAMGSPFPNLSFCPTGGISANDFRDYLALPNVVCVGGSWLAPKAAVQAGDWQAITALAAAACQ